MGKGRSGRSLWDVWKMVGEIEPCYARWRRIRVLALKENKMFHRTHVSELFKRHIALHTYVYPRVRGNLKIYSSCSYCVELNSRQQSLGYEWFGTKRFQMPSTKTSFPGCLHTFCCLKKLMQWTNLLSIGNLVSFTRNKIAREISRLDSAKEIIVSCFSNEIFPIYNWLAIIKICDGR